ncbi:Peptidyl-prolyl cis-trans isomerase fkbp12 [Orobanche minor]
MAHSNVSSSDPRQYRLVVVPGTGSWLKPVEKETLKAGTGPTPRIGQLVTVDYTSYGLCGDPKELCFRERSPRASLEKLEKCLEEGVSQMQVGEVARILVPLVYGGSIPGHYQYALPRHTYEIELLSVEDQNEPEEEE